MTQTGDMIKTERKLSAIDAMAQRLQVSRDTLEKTLKATAFRDCKTNEEFVSAIIVANTYQLNPLLGEIYAFPSKRGGVTPIVPIDGWISLVNRSPENDGVELIENRTPGKKNLSETDVDSVTAKFYQKGKGHPITVTEYMVECFDGNKQPWKKWPIRMLRHKAYIQGARIAYGFSGIYDNDEAERIEEATLIDDAPMIPMPQAKTPPPSAQAQPEIVDPSANTESRSDDPGVVLPEVTEKEVDSLKKLAAQAGISEKKLLDTIGKEGFESFDTITRAFYLRLMKSIAKKIDEQAAEK